MHGVAMTVGDDLYFDMTAKLDVLFEIDGGILEGVFGLGLGLAEAGAKGDVVMRDAHSAPAANPPRL